VARPKTDFYANSQWHDGRHPYCKRCLLAYQRDRRTERLDRENPTRRRWSRSFVRHDYFSRIDEPVKAYIAGLLAADGNVLEHQQRLSLELAHRDRQLVYLVRDQLAPRFPVRERHRKNGSHTVQFAITSSELCGGLAGLGIVPRKSLTLEWPRTLERSSARLFLLGLRR
jgi:LAGLIDADG DNA endonuclease family protein